MTADTPARRPYNPHRARVGDRVTLERDGRQTHLTVWNVTPAGTAGRSYAAGPTVWAHVRPGGYGVTFDAASYHAPHVFHADPADSEDTPS